MMSAVVTGVLEGSLAQRGGVLVGDTLLSVNGNAVADVLDYQFYLADTQASMKFLDQTGRIKHVRIRKGEYEDVGLCFETYLMDEKRSCRNRCIFCFIDQLPPGMRPSLYFKDDDARLSFLMGNYITLSGLTGRELRRITEMHLSPVNISVHATDPQLRVKMMRNPEAGRALGIMKHLAGHHIKMNCQIVLCRGINDGEALSRTLGDLSALYPAVESIAVVPVGLTKYREGLYALEPFGKAESAAVLDLVGAFSEDFLRRNGTRLVYAADEFYLMAQREIPPAASYEGMLQLENGVGLVAMLREGFDTALAQDAGAPQSPPRVVSVATGTAAFGVIENCAMRAQKAIAGLECLVYAIENRFFGENVNVAGLVTGRDLIEQLRGRRLGSELLIPAAMLRHERDLFLDDVSVSDVERELDTKVTPVENDGAQLLRAMTRGGPGM